MLVTAVVKNSSLIISNIDLSALHGQIDEYGMVKIELNFLEQLKACENPNEKDNNWLNSPL